MTHQPKECPILFNGDMVRAILDGRKTMTRRVVKNQTPSWHLLSKDYDVEGMEYFIATSKPDSNSIKSILGAEQCPYGQVGDRLWVRESWATDAQVDDVKPSDLSKGETIVYLADDTVRTTGCRLISKGKNRPSTHMPRWASRILLEVTDVRVERLQDITEEDAKADGVAFFDEVHNHQPMYMDYETDEFWLRTPKESFKSLWQSINKKRGYVWDANPWVWVVSFKVLEENQNLVQAPKGGRTMKGTKSFEDLLQSELLDIDVALEYIQPAHTQLERKYALIKVIEAHTNAAVAAEKLKLNGAKLEREMCIKQDDDHRRKAFAELVGKQISKGGE